MFSDPVQCSPVKVQISAVAIIAADLLSLQWLPATAAAAARGVASSSAAPAAAGAAGAGWQRMMPLLISEDFSLLVTFLLVTFSWLFRRTQHAPLESSHPYGKTTPRL